MHYLKYFLAPLVSLVVFSLMFQIWKLDLSMPAFTYNNDGLFIFFITKSIIDTGWIVSNPYLGMPQLDTVFSMNDFPLGADSFHFLILKFFTYFSHDTFLVTNCYFITTFLLISGACFIALRAFGISTFTAIAISTIYTFLPYHFVRNVWHLYLSNYMVVPLAVMIGLWISSGKMRAIELNAKNQIQFSRNRLFLISLVICCLIAMNDIYYAYYSCIIFLISWLLYGLKNNSLFNGKAVSPIFLCAMVFFTVILLYLPTISYQMQHGFNNHIALRSAGESEYFGLKIVNLLLPVNNHYIDYFANLRNLFDLSVSSNAEREAESLGIVGSIGFMFLILWLIGKSLSQEHSILNKTINRLSLTKYDQKLISDLAILNILLVLFATSGGLVMFISLPFPTIRSHARICVFIAFISLFVIAIIFDKIIEKKLYDKKIVAQLMVLVITTLAIFDQVGRASASTVQSEERKNKFANDKHFIESIETSLPEESMIFVLPFFGGFPEQPNDDYRSLLGYIHSKNLRWSYPAIVGRPSALWQKEVVNLEFEEFIAALKEAGFSGIYMDRTQYGDQHGWDELGELETKLKAVAKRPRMSSRNKKLVFYEI